MRCNQATTGRSAVRRNARIVVDVRPLQMSSRYQGTGVYCSNLVRHLAERDRVNEYVLLRRRGVSFEHLPFAMNVRAAPVRRFYNQDQRMLPFLDQILTPRDLFKTGADLYHAPSIYYHCRYVPCASVLTILDLIPLIYPSQYTQTGWKHRMLYRFARKADHILTPSESARRDVHGYLGIPLGKITVTPFAADERFRPARDPSRVHALLERLGITQPYILYTGGFTKRDERKNVMQLVEIFRELRQNGYEDLSLVLAGKLGPYSEEIVGAMKEQGGPPGVLFPGHLDHSDLPFLYNGAVCFVYPSRYEGFGMPPLEAMACGTPTIAYNNSSLPEVLGEAGILVDERAPRSLYEAVSVVLDQRERAEEMREKGLRQAARFTWQKTAEKTLAVYRQVLEKRQVPGRARA